MAKLFLKIDELNKASCKKLDDAINKIKPKMIDAFSLYYGTKYKDYISFMINDIKYLYYLSEDLMHQFARKKYCNDIKSYKILQTYLKFFAYNYRISKYIPDSEILSFLKNKFIVKIDNDIDILRSGVLSVLELNTPVSTYVVNKNNEIKNLIALSLYPVTLKTIFHEVNHVLSTEIIGIKDDTLITSDFMKSVDAMELLNDYIANQVMQIYFQIGGDEPEYFKQFKVDDAYKRAYYLIEPFYFLFDSVIKEALMSKNFRLSRLFNEELFQKYSILISEFVEGRGDYQELCYIVEEMYEYCISLEIEDLKSYLDSKSKDGIKVRRLI